MDQLQVNALIESAVFMEIGKEEIEPILGDMHYQVKSFEKGVMIAQSGLPCEHARIILEGNVAGEMMDLSGKILKIEDLGPSKMIAPAFLYGNRRSYPVNVIASSRVTIWQMHRNDFSKLLQTDLRLLDNFLNAISGRAQFLSEKIRFLSFPTLRAKLAFLFLQQAGENNSFRLPMTHQQIAELFGVTRPSLSREIRMMNNQGYIAADRETVRITDRKKLQGILRKN